LSQKNNEIRIKRKQRRHRASFYRVLDARPGAQPERIKPQNSKSTFIIESGAISFSEVIPGKDKDLPGSIAIRVFSDSNWRLKVVATSPLQILDHTAGSHLSFKDPGQCDDRIRAFWGSPHDFNRSRAKDKSFR